MTRARQVLCFFYFAVALTAFVACWMQNWSYLPAGPVAGSIAFWSDTMVTPASRSITLDILFFTLSAAAWMVTESRRLRIRWVSLYILFGILIAISVTFPLFLIAREKAIADTGA